MHSAQNDPPPRKTTPETGASRPPGSPNRARLSPTAVAKSAARQLHELIGLPMEMVSGLERTGDGWKLSVEVVELDRVPESMSLLGTYDVEVDRQGRLVRYRRRRRYARGQSD